MLNIAQKFRSPLREEGVITDHGDVKEIVKQTLVLLRGVPRAGREARSRGMEAHGAIVVNHTNIKGDITTLETGTPAPSPEDPMHYANFLSDLCESFSERFGRT